MSENRQIPLFAPVTAEELTVSATLAQAIAFFAEYLRRSGKTQHTINAFDADIRLLAEHVDEKTPLGELSTVALNRFLHWMEQERGVPCSQKTYARRVTTLKVFFKWLHEIEAIPRDPALAVMQRSGPAPLSLALTPRQAADALAFAATLNGGEKPDARPELLLRLLLKTGIKKNETMTLTSEHLDLRDRGNPLVVVRHESAKDVYKERILALEPEWVEVYADYRAQYTMKTTIFTCTARNLEYILDDVGKGAGLPFKISFEILRWTCAVRDHRAGVPEDAIREKLGLSKISWYETGAKIKTLVEAQERAGE